MVINGACGFAPRPLAISLNLASFFETYSSGWSEISPAIGRSSAPNTSPSETTIKPPPISISFLAAKSISSSFAPIMIRLWESCATDDPIAPLLSPNP